MNVALKTRANRAMHTAARGTMAQVDALEDEMGCALSTVLDHLWDEAEHAGMKDLARRLEQAFNRLTGFEQGG